MTAAIRTKGLVDIQEGWGEETGFMCYRAVFHVYDWSEHGDAGAIVGEFETRKEAITFAHQWAEEHGRNLAEADVLPLPSPTEGPA